MPGLAQTDHFMLGTATIMLGPIEDLYDLNPADHSIGLVKNFIINEEPVFTELTQGRQNDVVHSTKTGNPVRCTMEAYEYTSKNLAYALGNENASLVEAQNFVTATNGAVSAGDMTIAVDSATDIAQGDFVMFKVDSEDDFVVRRVTNVAASTLTVHAALPSIPDGTVVKKVNMIGGGSRAVQPYYCAKIVGALANDEEVVLLLPKLRIIRGFSLGFQTENYGNLPLEFTIYSQLPADPFYSEFGRNQYQIFAQN